jgi:two-component system, cell cycle response regulator
VEADKAKAVEAAEALRQALAAERFESQGQAFQATLSAGVAVYPDEATTPQQLVRTADQRLYQAKSQGRNRVVS